MRRGTHLLIAAALVAPIAAAPAWAENEKGARKCSDGVDNDGDGDIDAADSDCSGGGGSLPTGNFRITIDWDGAITDHVFSDATIDCGNLSCDLTAADPFTFRIPSTYWMQWSDDEAADCFGSPLYDAGGQPLSAEVNAASLQVRDHHGSDDHWRVSLHYEASLIGSNTPPVGHSANLQGDCIGPCSDLPPPDGATNSYDLGYLTRTQGPSKGEQKKLGGTPCTCAWEDCVFAPNEVTVTVEALP